jgi:predicted  nucleic acid-binding Zn-ribbon protein
VSNLPQQPQPSSSSSSNNNIPSSPVGSAGLIKHLKQENAQLKVRLAAVEDTAADALGEVEELKDLVENHKQARRAAEQQVRRGSSIQGSCTL